MAAFVLAARLGLPFDRSRVALIYGIGSHGLRTLMMTANTTTRLSKAAATVLKLPIHAYRYSLSMLIGRQCRHLPTCSEYAIDAIDLNGPWRGFWLGLSRVSRCRPGGSSGFDPAPDIRAERHPLWAPWRYGRWRTCDTARQVSS